MKSEGGAREEEEEDKDRIEGQMKRREEVVKIEPDKNGWKMLG